MLGDESVADVHTESIERGGPLGRLPKDIDTAVHGVAAPSNQGTNLSRASADISKLVERLQY